MSRSKKAERLFRNLQAGSEARNLPDEVKNFIRLQNEEKEKLEDENRKLAKLDELTQQQSMLNEQRFMEEIEQLEVQLQRAVLSRLDDSEPMNKLRLVNRKIQDNVATMRGVAEKQAREEKENLVSAFKTQISQKTAELETEKAHGQSTTGEWQTKNKELQAQLDDLLCRTESMHDVNKVLQEKNKVLQVEYKAQEDDHVILQNNMQMARSRNAQMKGRVHQLEAEIAELQKEKRQKDESGVEDTLLNSLRNVAGVAQSVEQQKRQEETKRKMAQLVKEEQKKLQQAKIALNKAKKNRTELEVLLKSAIEEVRGGITRKEMAQGFNQEQGEQLSLAEFTAANRRQVIEVMLSQERVLQLLYASEPVAVGDIDETEDGEGGAEGEEGQREEGGEDMTVSADPYWDLWKTLNSGTEPPPPQRDLEGPPSRSTAISGVPPPSQGPPRSLPPIPRPASATGHNAHMGVAEMDDIPAPSGFGGS